MCLYVSIFLGCGNYPGSPEVNDKLNQEKTITEKNDKLFEEMQEQKIRDKKIRESRWKEEAKLFNGTLQELCESITKRSNTYSSNGQKCMSDHPILNQKYNTMKPLLIDKHNKIINDRNEAKLKQKELQLKLEEAFKQKWEDRINKVKRVESGKSYICETDAYGNVTNSIFSPTKGELRIGESSIDFNGHILYSIDDYGTYFLLEGHNRSNYKTIRGKLFKEKGLNNSPYNLEINGNGYFCE